MRHCPNCDTCVVCGYSSEERVLKYHDLVERTLKQAAALLEDAGGNYITSSTGGESLQSLQGTYFLRAAKLIRDMENETP